MTRTGDHKHFYRFEKWISFRNAQVMQFKCKVEGCKDWRLVPMGFFQQ